MHRDTKKILRKIYDSGVTFESTLNEKYSFDKIIDQHLIDLELPKGNVLLKIEEWEHTCHDGCCYTYGTKVFINNKQVTSGYANEIGTILEEVLKYLDYDVQLDFNRNVE